MILEADGSVVLADHTQYIGSAEDVPDATSNVPSAEQESICTGSGVSDAVVPYCVFGKIRLT